MEYFLKSLDTYSIILAVLLLILFCIQVFYYVKYYSKTYIPQSTKEINNNVKKQKVSVIISAENEAYRLQKLLPVLLEQDYPDFEVIIVNNGSTDETDYLIEDLKLKYDNLYATFLPKSPDKEFGFKKLALTIGVKASKGDILLFSEAYCVPMSNQWINSMVADLNNDPSKEVVLGVTSIKKEKSFFNRIARYDNLFFTMEYVAKALENNPFTGTFRNVAFRKEKFFEVKGFASFLTLPNSEDVFINKIVSKDNTSICLNQDSYTEWNVDSYALWRIAKKNYSMAKMYFTGKSVIFFANESLVRTLFYICVILGVIGSVIKGNFVLLGFILLLFFIRLIFQTVILNKAMKLFHNGPFKLSLPFIDFITPIYCLRFKARHKNLIAYNNQKKRNESYFSHS